MPSILLEVCVDSLQSVQNAVVAGASRIELCSCLFQGGLTPSSGLLKLSKEIAKDVPIFAMLRARPGDDFVFSEDEQRVMLADLEVLKGLGADGFVYGALNEDGTVNTNFCSSIVKAASPLPVTFHRAFDVVANDLGALETIIAMNFKRILTSGREKSAADKAACTRINTYLNAAQNRITIIAGAGITVLNVERVLETGVKEIHGSFKMHRQLPMLKHMQKSNTKEKETVEITDEKHVRNILQVLKSFA